MHTYTLTCNIVQQLFLREFVEFQTRATSPPRPSNSAIHDEERASVTVKKIKIVPDFTLADKKGRRELQCRCREL
jgi:hypothetical protein